MAARDPTTGQFISADDRRAFDDIEVVNARAGIGIEAANNSGGTGFSGGATDILEGEELVDFDEVLDRDEVAHLLEAQHRLVVYVNSTETVDGTLAAAVQVSSSPVSLGGEPVLTGSNAISGDFVGQLNVDDSIDLIGRTLMAVSYAPFSDTTNQLGGAGGAGTDEVHVTDLPTQVAQFHPRDELFANVEMTQWLIDDAGIHLQLEVQHTYGISER